MFGHIEMSEIVFEDGLADAAVAVALGGFGDVLNKRVFYNLDLLLFGLGRSCFMQIQIALKILGDLHLSSTRLY
jgi:hypothetical protein